MTPGRASLLVILQRTRREYVAARCRVSVSAVHDWCSGRRAPKTEARIVLSVTYGIPVESWEVRRTVTGYLD